MDEKTSLEAIASNPDEAIQKGLAELGLSLDDVDIEILDEGGSGLFGVGERLARVKLSIKDPQKTPPDASKIKVPSQKSRDSDISQEDVENTMSVAKATVQELLEHMGIYGDVEARLGEISEDEKGQAPIIIDIKGNDLSILIGHRAETLDALQLITRMIVGKELGHSAHLIVDVEGYRTRREESLRQLAQKMAGQAIDLGRNQELEPMTPAERRIIHIELRDNGSVSTESSGSEPKRKVVISPV